MKNVFTGLFAGLINGLLGSGGGVIIVPALEFIHRLQEHKSHATAIAVILPITLVSSVIYLLKGSVVWDATLKVGAGAVVGGLIGALLLNRFKGATLRKIFGIVMIVTAVRLFV
jgi:uncharacterized membrane protein YfcA